MTEWYSRGYLGDENLMLIGHVRLSLHQLRPRHCMLLFCAFVLACFKAVS